MVTFLASTMASDVTWAVVSAVASASRLPLVSNVNTKTFYGQYTNTDINS